KRGPEASGKSYHQNFNRLGQILYTLIVESQINILHTLKKGLSYPNQMGLLKKEIENKNIARGIPLKDYFHFSFTEKSLAFAQRKLENPQKVLGHVWPKSLKPFVLFINISHQITSKSFLTKELGVIETSSKVNLPSP